MNPFLKIDNISRKFLIDVASASSNSNHPVMVSVIAKLEAAGAFADATEDEIEEFDAAMELAEA